ncbi:hypothetical protein FQN57_001026 [Myotisia sp. PD_48]|nr:hypothetical protein FQN57_001026 [Myotisia sp. PD_48]
MLAANIDARINSLTASLENISRRVNQLRQLGSRYGRDEDEERLNIGVEIHRDLGAAEDEIELLHGELQHLKGSSGPPHQDADALDAEKRQRSSRMAMLEADLGKTRLMFRRAQLSAKQNAENAQRKEWQALFGQRSDVKQRRAPSKLSHDEMVVNASKDVTSALQHTHRLIEEELSRSHFVQETLEQSTQTLNSLSESYSNLDNLLASSGSLVRSLLHSQKSDTWYLEMSFYLLLGTIIWLAFHRIFYGPLWWLVYMPVTLVFKGAYAIVAVFSYSISGKSSTVGQPVDPLPLYTETVSAHSSPTITWSKDGVDEAESASGDSAAIENMMSLISGDQPSSDSDAKETIMPFISGDGDADSIQRSSGNTEGHEEGSFPNTKKRMWEETENVDMR